MRPAGIYGQVRRAVLDAVRRLAAAQSAATVQEIALATCVVAGPDEWGAEGLRQGLALPVARYTLRRLINAGDVVCVGRTKAAGSSIWHALYAPVDVCAQAGQPGGAARPDAALQAAMRDWARLCSQEAAQEAAM